eukprot:COSAG02_NODE_258_length_26815_cov_12.034998_2_plen_99_part_00
MKLHYHGRAGNFGRSSGGHIYGYVKGSLVVKGHKGDCKCKNKKKDIYGNQIKVLDSKGRGFSCKSGFGGKGKFEITAEFVDFGIGDGANGVDVRTVFT